MIYLLDATHSVRRYGFDVPLVAHENKR